MKNGIVINSKNHTIEMNKGFAKAASLFGSPEYEELQAARRDYPQFRVVTISKKAAKPEYKGLTIEYMEKYIAAHDDDGTIMEEFRMLRGTSEAGQNADAGSVDFSTMSRS